MAENRVPIKNLILSSIPTKQVNMNSILKVNYNPEKKIISSMPSKFQSSDGTSTFSKGRKIFINNEKPYGDLPTSNFQVKKAFQEEGKCSYTNSDHPTTLNCSNTCNVNRKNRCSVGKYISVQSSGERIQRLKNNAVGRGSMAKSQNNKYVTSFTGDNTYNSINYQNTQQALRRLRNRGYVVPPKVTNRITSNC
tara:strand:- start:238 stop:819 length:582 start_codon:yes stop_codon:yes gene_type:complete